MKTKTCFTFRVDVWDSAANSILEHIAGIEDFEVAETTYRAAVARWPAARITLRQGARVVMKSWTERLRESCNVFESCGIALDRAHEHTDAPHPLALLRARRLRPRRDTAEQRDELAPSHSITSSARASSVGGTSRPSAFAVFRLIDSSYFVGACTGRSASFSPLRMRST